MSKWVHITLSDWTYVQVNTYYFEALDICPSEDILLWVTGHMSKWIHITLSNLTYVQVKTYYFESLDICLSEYISLWVT